MVGNYRTDRQLTGSHLASGALGYAGRNENLVLVLRCNLTVVTSLGFAGISRGVSDVMLMYLLNVKESARARTRSPDSLILSISGRLAMDTRGIPAAFPNVRRLMEVRN
jgi:hypothetical protein